MTALAISGDLTGVVGVGGLADAGHSASVLVQEVVEDLAVLVDHLGDVLEGHRVLVLRLALRLDHDCIFKHQQKPAKKERFLI